MLLKIKYENYRNVLFNDATNMIYETNRIESKNHNKGTYRINKVYVLLRWQKICTLDGYSRLSHFHKSIR